MKSLWMMWDAREKDMADEYNIMAEEFPEIDAEVGYGQQGGNRSDNELRRSKIRWVKDEDLKKKMYNYAEYANRILWNFDINYMEDIQHTRYDADNKGHYDWHIDTFWENTANLYDRKISVIIQLTDGDEYEGGDFIIDPQYPQPPKDLMRKKGTVFAFPSFIRHRVEPVTSGTRKSFVTWVEGPAFR